MSRASGLLRALLEGLVDLSKRSSDQKQAGRGSALGRQQHETGVAKWRSSGSKQSSVSIEAGEDDESASPGRFGSEATRDLRTEEIRVLRPSFSPNLDGDPDPGEVIWTWVPYAENDGRGKDRPVLIIAKLDGQESWAGCYLSTKAHRGFVSVGTGAWDSKGRESFLAPDRVLRVTAEGMRRESTGMDKVRFDRAVEVVLRWHGASAA